ncbi:MAG TPA: hypothetical protein VEO53_01045, partial [Candidatus Binatia bacterium]|nr:hypothetical protein [Candidatus Binatia bacterium]
DIHDLVARHRAGDDLPRFTSDARRARSRQEHVGRHAKVSGQSPNMIERQLAFAAPNHRARPPASARQPRQNGRHALQSALTQ